MDDGSTTADSDDLEIVKVTKKYLADKPSRTDGSNPVDKRQAHKHQPKKKAALHGNELRIEAGIDHSQEHVIKVEWTEDEFEFQPAIKKSKSLKRKRPGRKPKEAKAEGSKQKRLKRTDDGIVVEPQKVTEDEQSPEENDVEVPEYIEARRTTFDKRTKILREGGLKLPPDYDNIDFSDDERLEDLQERPNFINIKPNAEYKDKELYASLGLIPAPIAQWLRDYQVQGAAFLHKLFVYQQGGILGDDMGKLCWARNLPEPLEAC